MTPAFRTGRALNRSALLVAVLAALGALPAAGQSRPASSLPTRLTDAEFWGLVTSTSESGGSFPSENFTSNELSYPRIVNMLRAANDTGGVYLGVGPEQNFSYMTGIRPQMAFLVDIRRQSVIQHLMYKAIFELSEDRADFLSLLFTKPRPAGLDTTASIGALWDAYWYVDTDTAGKRAFTRNLARISDHLTKTHGFALDSSDLGTLAHVYQVFYEAGPQISYSSRLGAGTGGSSSPTSLVYSSSGWFVAARSMVTGAAITAAGSTVSVVSPRVIPGLILTNSGSTTSWYGGTNFAALTAATDEGSAPRSFLATEGNYRFLKDLETRNLFVPVVGDFAGPKAIRGVGEYVRAHGSTITAFYTSNVEQYLFSNQVWREFYQNVATLPITSGSVFIRNGSSICPIGEFIAAFQAGRILGYTDATGCTR